MSETLVSKVAVASSIFGSISGKSARFLYLGKKEVAELEDIIKWMFPRDDSVHYYFVSGACVWMGLKVFEVEANSHLAVS